MERTASDSIVTLGACHRGRGVGRAPGARLPAAALSLARRHTSTHAITRPDPACTKLHPTWDHNIMKSGQERPSTGDLSVDCLSTSQYLISGLPLPASLVFSYSLAFLYHCITVIMTYPPTLTTLKCFCLDYLVFP